MTPDTLYRVSATGNPELGGIDSQVTARWKRLEGPQRQNA